MRRVLAGSALLLCAAAPVRAQASAEMSSAVGRARSLMDGGAGGAARTLLDSLVTRSEPASDDLAEALFWRAVLSERVADGERDWKRLVVDVPLSPRAPDALLRLGELEVLRGRPAVARAHFERILRDFSESPLRPKAMIWIARSYFEERDAPHACEAVRALRAGEVPEGELKLQANELQLRCLTAGTATAGGGTATAGGGTATAGGGTATAGGGTATAIAGTSAAVAVPPAVAGTSAPAVFSVQLAAYDTRAQANALVQRLAKRGVKARIDGERKPYRVRVGRYETRAEAAAMLARLKKQGHGGFVAELGR